MPIRAVAHRALVLGIFALIPGLAATGLSLPLPSAVERIAAALVPWVEAATLADQPVAIGAAGSIVLTSSERRSGGDAASVGKASATPRAQGLNRPQPSGARRATLKPPATAPVRGGTKPATPTERVDAKPEQSRAEPDPTVPILVAAEPIRSTSSDPRPDAGTLPKPNPISQPQPDLGPLPNPVTNPPPAQTPPSPTPAQPVLDDTLVIVAETTQTIVDNTVPALSETVEPVTEIISNPVGAVGAIVSNPVQGLLDLVRGLLGGRRK